MCGNLDLWCVWGNPELPVSFWEKREGIAFGYDFKIFEKIN